MRLVDTTSLKFRDVGEDQLRKTEKGYSILSHKWRDEEVEHADVLSDDPNITLKAGYSKFSKSCALAKRLGFDLIWIDTCCIDKTNSSELGEAINSMYRWYANANTCIAHLDDVESAAQLSQSTWFDRGWTLQELIAPKLVEFYGRTWNVLGDKSALSQAIVLTTGIPADILQNKRAPQTCSVAQRMSWAAKRATTRIEDRAYSLMGLFDVYMPMIYGEQDRAFIRLQEQIILRSTDESIFAWHLDLLEDAEQDTKRKCSGLLAPSPACFAKSGDFISTGRSRGFRNNQFGISVTLPSTMYSLNLFEATLMVGSSKSQGNYAIILAQLPDNESYVRIINSSGQSLIATESQQTTYREFNVSSNPPEAVVVLFPGFWIRHIDFCDLPNSHAQILSRGPSTYPDRLLLPFNEAGTAGIVKLTFPASTNPNYLGWIKFGFDKNFSPVCFMTFAFQLEKTAFLNSFAEASKLEIGSYRRQNHPLFSDDWLQVTSRDIASFPQYSHNFRATAADITSKKTVRFKAPAFTIEISLASIPDVMAPTYMSQNKIQLPTISQSDPYVWAVDVCVITKRSPTVTYNGHQDTDDNCCFL